MIRMCGFPLSPFCGLTSEEWEKLWHEYGEIHDNTPGGDITDDGLGRSHEAAGFSRVVLYNSNVVGLLV